MVGKYDGHIQLITAICHDYRTAISSLIVIPNITAMMFGKGCKKTTLMAIIGCNCVSTNSL
jgi:hypothetical protein